MIGLIVTGHGDFAKGLTHSLTMIAGKQNHVKPVLFNDGMNLEEYEEQLSSSLTSDKDGYVILADLKGGTPFNVSMMLTESNDAVRVIAGINLPMLIEGAMLSQLETDVDKLVALLIKTGRENIDSISISDVSPDKEMDGDGI